MKETWTKDAQLPYWLALVRLPGVGPAKAQRLLAQWGTPRRLFEAPSSELTELDAATRTAIQRPPWSAVEHDLKWLEPVDHHAVTFHDAAYPPLLKEIADPPPLLFMRGDPALLAAPQLAIVGSRNPSPGGAQTALEFARHLASLGLVITSGLAVGIDAAAHRGALAGDGLTLAVAGTGLDQVYPAAHRKLAEAIVARGALLSEFPPGTPPRPEHFPRRNRLISGLSLGTLVVEAALRSGSLITARQAVEQGREVFAIPGSIHNPMSRGCNALLRQGAKLVENTQDILEELGPLAAWNNSSTPFPAPARPEGEDSREARQLLPHLGFEPTAVDTLVERSGLTAEQVSSILVVLELHGQVTSAPGGLYTRTP